MLIVAAMQVVTKKRRTKEMNLLLLFRANKMDTVHMLITCAARRYDFCKSVNKKLPFIFYIYFKITFYK